MNLVTGATGLVGSHIAAALVERGLPTRTLVRAGTDGRFLEALGVDLVPGALEDRGSLEWACRDVEVIFHAAAKVGDWGAEDEFHAVNVEGTDRLLEAALAAGVGRFVHISSVAVYGYPSRTTAVVEESSPLGQNLERRHGYARSKIEAERRVREQSRRGFGFTILRPAWIYGPRDRVSFSRLEHALVSRLATLVGSGDNLLNLVFAANVAECALLAARSDRARGEAYNVVNTDPITQREFLNRLAAALGAPEVRRRVPFWVADGTARLAEWCGRRLSRRAPPRVTRHAVWLLGRRVYYSPDKAVRDLGWRSSVGHAEGIRRTVAHFREAHRGQSE